MLELIIKRTEQDRKLALIEDGNLLEYYEESENSNRREGNIYVGIVKDIVKGMQVAFVDVGADKNSLIHVKDLVEKKDEKEEEKETEKSIDDLVKINQKLLVQIKKDSNDKKGAKISTHINLPGKYIALMPNTNIVTVSQKIEDKKEQERLIKLVKDNISNCNGAIIRTSAEGKEKEVIEDIKKLEEKWKNIIETSNKVEGKRAQLVYKSEDIVEKMLIDLANKGIDNVFVNDSKDYNQIKNWQEKNIEYKDMKIIVKSEENIFDIYELEKQINK